MADVLAVKIDHAQPRNIREELGFLTVGGADGEKITDRPIVGYSRTFRSTTDGEDDTWIDPITGTLMLMPLPLLSAWQSTSSGDFARLGLSDLTVITGANWLEHNANGLASKYIHGKSATVQEAIRTTASQSAGQPMYLSAKVSSSDSEDRVLFDVGWGYTGRATPTDTIANRAVYLKVYTSGAVDVYFNGTLSSSGSLAPTGQTSGSTINDQWLKLLLIPMGTGILIYSTNGGGFFWERPDLEPGEEDPVITPAADFWWYSYGAATVEVAPIRFRTSGWRLSLGCEFASAPEPGDAQLHRAYRDGPTGAAAVFVEYEDASTEFVPDGIKKQCHVKYTLTGDGDSTPFIYAVHSIYDLENGETDGSEEKDISPYIHRAGFDVSETGEISADIEIVRPQDLDDELGEVPHLETQSMRPVLLRVGEVDFMDMVVMERPKVSRGLYRNADKIQMRLGGLYELLRRKQFRDFYPLDQATVSGALLRLCQQSGIPEERTDIESFTDLNIGEFTRPSKGEFHALIKPNDTAAQWWEFIFREYLQDCHWCERPTADGSTKLTVYSVDNRPLLATPYEIFDTMEAATDHLEGIGIEGDEAFLQAPTRVFRTVDSYGLPAEAGEVWVSGMNRKDRKPIEVSSTIDEIVDPRIKPSERTADWTGDRLKYHFDSKALATQSQCEDALSRLVRRLTYGRELIEIEIDMMIDPETGVPLWTGDVVKVTLREDDPADYTIVRFGGEFLREFDGTDQESPIIVRPCRYVLEKIVEDTCEGLGHSLPGRSLNEMVAAADIRRWRMLQYEVKNLAPRTVLL